MCLAPQGRAETRGIFSCLQARGEVSLPSQVWPVSPTTKLICLQGEWGSGPWIKVLTHPPCLPPAKRRKQLLSEKGKETRRARHIHGKAFWVRRQDECSVVSYEANALIPPGEGQSRSSL